MVRLLLRATEQRGVAICTVGRLRLQSSDGCGCQRPIVGYALLAESMLLIDQPRIRHLPCKVSIHLLPPMACVTFPCSRRMLLTCACDGLLVFEYESIEVPQESYKEPPSKAIGLPFHTRKGRLALALRLGRILRQHPTGLGCRLFALVATILRCGRHAPAAMHYPERRAICLALRNGRHAGGAVAVVGFDVCQQSAPTASAACAETLGTPRSSEGLPLLPVRLAVQSLVTRLAAVRSPLRIPCPMELVRCLRGPTLPANDVLIGRPDGILHARIEVIDTPGENRSPTEILWRVWHGWRSARVSTNSPRARDRSRPTARWLPV